MLICISRQHLRPMWISLIDFPFSNQLPPEGANKSPSITFNLCAPVNVADAVPTPVVRMSAVHFNLSGELCNITVNCSIQDDWVWSVCVEDSCRTSQRSLRKVNITVSAENRTVTCSGNNYVSTSSISVSAEAMCEYNGMFLSGVFVGVLLTRRRFTEL